MVFRSKRRTSSNQKDWGLPRISRRNRHRKHGFVAFSKEKCHYCSYILKNHGNGWSSCWLCSSSTWVFRQNSKKHQRNGKDFLAKMSAKGIMVRAFGRNEAICKSIRRTILVFNHRLNIEYAGFGEVYNLSKIFNILHSPLYTLHSLHYNQNHGWGSPKNAYPPPINWIRTCT